MKKRAISKPRFSGPKIIWKRPLFMEKRVADRIKKENGMLRKMVNELPRKPVNAAKARKIFEKTYLKNPCLKRRGKKASSGWGEVLKELKLIVAKHTLSKIQSEVTLEYIPLKKKTPAKKDIDLKAHVRTTLFFRSDGIDVDIEGDLYHKRPCPLEP